MLEDILESNQKSAVLAFFLLSPERAFSIKELSKRLHMSESNMQSILREFSKYSFTTQFSRDKQVLHIVNPRHKLLPEIKLSLTKNQRRLDDELFTAIGKLGEINGAFLSGVFTGQPQLPVDLLLVGKINLTKLTFSRPARK
jgi:AraC-like DNA-binding protein